MKLLFVTVLLAVSAIASAQHEQFTFSISTGNRAIHYDSISNSDNPDFLNYRYHNGLKGNYGMLLLEFGFSPDSNWKISSGFGIMSDLALHDATLSVSRKLGKYHRYHTWAIAAGFSLYSQYLNNYHQFQEVHDTLFTTFANSNFIQMDLLDITITAGPEYRFKAKRLNLEQGLKAGIAGFVPFYLTIAQKKEYSNLRREYRYQTHFSPAPAFISTTGFSYNLIETYDFKLAIMVEAIAMISSRTLKYRQTLSSWTLENALITDVSPQKQWYRFTELHAGLRFKFE